MFSRVLVLLILIAVFLLGGATDEVTAQSQNQLPCTPEGDQLQGDLEYTFQCSEGVCQLKAWQKGRVNDQFGFVGLAACVVESGD